MKTQIISISGKQGSGKTSLAKEIGRQLSGRKNWRTVFVNFADPLRKMEKYCWGVLENAGMERPDSVKTKDGGLMQYLGTEWGRQTISDDVWLRVLQGTIESETNRFGCGELPDRLIFIIGDCRFRNEFKLIPEALRVRLVCPVEVRKKRAENWRERESHPSEIDLDEFCNDGRFDLCLNTSSETAESCATLVIAQLMKESWIESRSAVGS